MFQVAVLLLIVSTGIAVNAIAADDQTEVRRIFRPYETTACEARQTPGLICPSCDVVATCVRINDEWLTVPVAECDNTAGMFCNVRQGGCSDLAGPCNSIGHSQNFVCSSVGMFPDPYDCQKYHFCMQSGNSLGAINVECGGSSAFNPATGQCSLNLNSDVCQFDQYDCDHVGQQAAWPGNDNIFYICNLRVTGDTSYHLYPTLYRCAGDEVFNGTLCVRSNTNVSTITPPPGTPSYNCPAFGLYPFEDDCHSYYFCNNDLLPHIYRCPEGTYFDGVLSGCVRGNCTDVGLWG